MSVRLHIDRLVIEGFDLPHASRGALQAALERELSRLIRQGGLARELAGGGAVPSVRAPQIATVASPKPEQLGGAIAAAVYGGVGGGKR
jgi:hypothetical protein